MLDLQGEGKYDSYFSVHDNVVTLIPLTNECRKYIHVLSHNDGSNEKTHWLHGVSEDGCSVAFLKKTHLSNVLSSPIDMDTSKFYAPIILKSIHPDGVDLKTFDSIEFHSGIVDILHTPALALDEKSNNRSINFNDRSVFTNKYNVEVNGEEFNLSYSVNTEDVGMEIGKVPDLKNAIHSVMRFDLETEKSLDDIETYYSYALKLCQFCTGRLNVGFEICLYKNEIYREKSINASSQVLVKFRDGFDDYANDNLDINKVIRFQFLGDNITKLLKLLNEEKTQPFLLFLPNRNKHLGSILYTDIGDICVAFEREFLFIETNYNRTNQEYAKALTKDILELIDDRSDYPYAVRKKATDILTSQLKGFSPSLKEKICALYDEFGQYIKSITEQKDHDKYGITQFYTPENFKEKISKFIKIRNKTSHAGIIWNDGIDIFPHLKLLIYSSILKRAGYTLEDSISMLSWLFGREF